MLNVIYDVTLQAYVQQLETSRLKLIQLEQEIDRARQQVEKTMCFTCSFCKALPEY